MHITIILETTKSEIFECNPDYIIYIHILYHRHEDNIILSERHQWKDAPCS